MTFGRHTPAKGNELPPMVRNRHRTRTWGCAAVTVLQEMPDDKKRGDATPGGAVRVDAIA